MSYLTLAITRPAHGDVLTAPVTLKASASGDTGNLYVKWYSSLYAGGSESHPELNAADHGLAALDYTVLSLSEFGSHTLLLSATDRDAPAETAAVTRAAMAGGAPPAAPFPCVVHQLAGAAFIQPPDLPSPPAAPDRPALSRASGAIRVLAPGAWLKPSAGNPAVWVANPDYQQLNGVALTLRIEPEGAPPQRRSVTLDFTTEMLPTLPSTRVPGLNGGPARNALTLASPLPAGLDNGAYRLVLMARSGSTSAAPLVRPVTLIA
ncbi:MAG: hypothetical protein RL722_959 [Pseudomonadota bacterium]|jgi:hypothetical protein